MSAAGAIVVIAVLAIVGYFIITSMSQPVAAPQVAYASGGGLGFSSASQPVMQADPSGITSLQSNKVSTDQYRVTDAGALSSALSPHSGSSLAGTTPFVRTSSGLAYTTADRNVRYA